MPQPTNSQPASHRDVQRSDRATGFAIAAALILGGSLFGYVVFSGQHAACAKTAGSEAGFWCLLPQIGMSLAIVIATAAAAILVIVMTARILGSSTVGRRLVPIVLGGGCVVVGFAALASVTPRSEGSSTPTGLWSPGSDADTTLVDRLLTAWTEGDTAAVDELYADDARLIPNPHSYDAKLAANLGYDAPPWVDRDGIRVAVVHTNTPYARVGPVTFTEAPVPGLAAPPTGGRYLHWVTKIRGQWFETVAVLGADGRIRDHYVDEYYGPDLRHEFGFRQFENVFGTPVPS
jgi:hypothetical protein